MGARAQRVRKTRLIPPEQALSEILSRCSLQPVEKVSLDRALGRVLARPLRADGDLPPADRSTMDGYAVRASDLASAPCELKRVGEVATGSKSRRRVEPGTCIRILTGANVPPRADAVAIVETTIEVGRGIVRFQSGVGRGDNVLPRGSIARKGQVLMKRGTRLDAPQIALCAAIGADPAPVFAQVRVGVLCTGEELTAPKARAARHAQRDSNGPALLAALAASGLAECKSHGIVGDRLPALRSKIKKALKTCDVLLISAGVSVGKYDLVPRVVKDLGCRTIFHGVRMKPGKPLLFAIGPAKQLVFGLPGKPLSSLTAFYEFVAPATRKMSGMETCEPITIRVRLLRAVTNRSGRVLFAPAQLHLSSSDGMPSAVAVEWQGSDDVVSGARCQGVVVLPEQREYNAGDLVEFHPWGAIA